MSGRLEEIDYVMVYGKTSPYVPTTLAAQQAKEYAKVLVEVARRSEVVVRRSRNAPWFREHYGINDLAHALARLDATTTEQT